MRVWKRHQAGGATGGTVSIAARSASHRPIRFAVTVTGIVGVCFSSSRTAGSTASTAEPFGARRYCGGRSEAVARSTVFLEILSCRATARPDDPSARSSTWITSRPPDSRPMKSG
ncbi:MAG: hypothetical protein QOF84_1571 [Streptomyces sp.]|nr:hypothetical protein [Streptomyces sp.]